MNYKEQIAAYEADVQSPNVSGMEHLNMLMNRSEIAKSEAHLTDQERQRLLEADKLLLQKANLFFQTISEIADLAAWRRDENVPVSHWWWYLDVITQMPPTNEKRARAGQQNMPTAH